jgi:hypothetical protein
MGLPQIQSPAACRLSARNYGSLHTSQAHCFISQLVTVQTDYPDCCPYIVQYIATYMALGATQD